MSKLKLGCWVAGAVILLTVVTIQIIKPVASQAGWDNVNALMANTLQVESIEVDGNAQKAAHNEPKKGAQIGVEQQTPNHSSSDNTGAAQHEKQQVAQNEALQEAQTLPPINQASQVDLINLNSATLEQLDTLPGIGPSKAKAIIDYRIKYGNFRSLEQLMEVKGIGPKIFAKMKGQIIISAQ